jgi:hypothetical protein
VTGPEFDSLYYTDCVPGQGLRGGAGFQFQAVSADVSHDTMSLVQRTALFEAPVAWMRDQRPVEDYPPSLTHVYDGVYVTARGRYLGAEANGVREGNQFTHAIASADPEAYGLTRPAQLWDAPWWAENAAPTTRCDPVPAEPEPGPWGVDQLREWVLGRPDGEDWLLAVHSAFDRLHGEGARRVLFVSDDATAVLAWIAAGTLLLAQSRALRIGFRVFTTNPRQSPHDVLAVHDDWAGALANPDRDEGFVVFNLSTWRHSTVEPTDGAWYWVPRFLRTEPYDVLDAIEVTQRLAGERDRPDAVHRLVGSIVVLGEPAADLAAAVGLVRWLRESPADLTEDILAPAVDAALAFRHDVATLGDLRAALDARGVTGELAERVRYESLSAELAAATGYPVTDPADASARSLVEAAARTAVPERMGAVLRIAGRFGVTPGIGEFSDAAYRFVQWWVGRPAEPVDRSGWPCEPEIIDLLRDELTARIARGASDRTVADIRDHWWRILPVTDPAAPLDAYVASAAIENGDARVRRQTIATVLDGLVPSARYAELAWAALFSFVWPTREELGKYLQAVPWRQLTGVPAEDARQAMERLLPARPAAADLDVLAQLVDHNAVPARSTLAVVGAQDAAVREWLAATPLRRAQLAKILRPVTEPVLAARAPAVLRALVDEMSAAELAQAMDTCGPALPGLLLRDLPDVWSDEEQTAARVEGSVALAFIAARSASCTDELETELLYALGQWLKSDRRLVPPVGRLLATADERLLEDWRVFTEPKSGRTGSPARKKAAAVTTSKSDDTAKETAIGRLFSRRGKDK